MNGYEPGRVRHPVWGFFLAGAPLVVPIYAVFNERPLVTFVGVIGWTIWILILNGVGHSRRGDGNDR